MSQFFVQATGPFLQIGALAATTALAWLVAGQVARGERTSKPNSLPHSKIRLSVRHHY